MVIDRVAEFIKENQLSDKKIIVGFSGGFDSMCLLDVLSELKKEPEFENMKIIAAHFNHNWRGEESLREQEVCRIFASARLTSALTTSILDFSPSSNIAFVRS